MNQNVLKYAHWITKFCIWLGTISAVILVGFFIYWLIEPSYFDNWYLKDPFKAGTAKLRFQFNRPSFDAGFQLNMLDKVGVSWLFIRAIIAGGLMIWGLIIINRIVNSVRSQQTFYRQNAASFKKMGLLGLVYTLLVSFGFGTIGHEAVFHFTIPFIPIVLAVSCYVLAIIFEEGSTLQEDTKSII